jgi:probable HAF family extracellular repeat protein
MKDLGDLPGGADMSGGNALNNAGQVVGSSRTVNGERAFLWDNTSGLQNLGNLPWWPFNASFATGINNAGNVVGYGESQYGLTQTMRAFLWSSGALEDLGDLSPNTFSYAAEGR